MKKIIFLLVLGANLLGSAPRFNEGPLCQPNDPNCKAVI